jgi:anti-anti-sigma factor
MNIRTGVFSIRREADRDGVRITLSGEMDLACLSRFEAAVADACRLGLGNVVLDLSALTFLDLAGLRAIYQAKDRIIASDQGFLFVPGPRHVQRLFGFADATGKLPFAHAGDLLVSGGEPLV